MPQIKVDRLNIRVKGVKTDQARLAVAGLREPIQTQLAGQEAFKIPPGKHHVDQINLSSIRIGRSTTSTELSDHIARLVIKTMITPPK